MGAVRESTAYERENKQGYRIRSFGESLRNRINTDLALQVLHKAMSGEPVTRGQMEAVRIALAKCLPDLKAVAIQLTDNTVSTKADIDQMLLSAGLQPDDTWNTIEGETVAAEIEQSTKENDKALTPEKK